MIGRCAFALAVAVVAAGSAAADTVVAVVGPMDTKWGEAIRTASTAAATDLIAAGRLPADVRVQFYDDKCGTDPAKEVSERIVAEGVRFVVGHYCAASTLMALPAYQQASVVVIAPTASFPPITEKGALVARIAGRDDELGRVAAATLSSRVGKVKGRIAAVGDGTTLAGWTLDGFQAGARDHGLDASRTDIPIDQLKADGGRAAASAIAAQRPAAVFVAGFAPMMGEIVLRLREAGVTAPILGNDRMLSPTFRKEAAGAADGLWSMGMPDWGTLPAARPLATRIGMENEDGRAAPYAFYAAFEVLGEAIRRAGSTAPAEVAGQLRNGKGFPTVTGSIDFNANGDREPAPFAWHRISVQGYAAVDQEATLAAVVADTRRRQEQARKAEEQRQLAEAQRRKEEAAAVERRRKQQEEYQRRVAASESARKAPGDHVCLDGRTFLGLMSTTIAGFVERVEGRKIQIRIVDDGGGVVYHGVRLFRDAIIWDDYDNWRNLGCG